MNMVSVLLCETAADVPGYNATLVPANSTVMTRLPDQECWDAYHLLYLVTPAMVTLAALYPVPSRYSHRQIHPCEPAALPSPMHGFCGR